jgi:hypothetical protein
LRPRNAAKSGSSAPLCENSARKDACCFVISFRSGMPLMAIGPLLTFALFSPG